MDSGGRAPLGRATWAALRPFALGVVSACQLQRPRSSCSGLSLQPRRRAPKGLPQSQQHAELHPKALRVRRGRSPWASWALSRSWRRSHRTAGDPTAATRTASPPSRRRCARPPHAPIDSPGVAHIPTLARACDRWEPTVPPALSSPLRCPLHGLTSSAPCAFRDRAELSSRARRSGNRRWPKRRAQARVAPPRAAT